VYILFEILKRSNTITTLVQRFLRIVVVR